MKACGFCNSFAGRVNTLCPKCKVVWWCDICLPANNTDNDFPRGEWCELINEHVSHCGADSSVKQPLAFKLYDVVVCSTGSGGYSRWERCVIIELWPTSAPVAGSPYRVRIERNNSDFYVLKDTHEHIRPANFDIGDCRQVILQMIKYGDVVEVMTQFVDAYRLDWTVYGPFLMHNAAAYGNITLFKHVVIDRLIDPCMLNSKGQNVLHLATLSNMSVMVHITMAMCENIGENKLLELLYDIDDEGRSVLHVMAIANSDVILYNLVMKHIKKPLYNNTNSAEFSALICQRDKKGRLAIEYFIMLKRTEFPLEGLLSLTINFQILTLSLAAKAEKSYNSDDTMLALCKSHLTIKGFASNTVQIEQESTEKCLLSLLSLMIDNSYAKSFEWLAVDPSGLRILLQFPHMVQELQQRVLLIDEALLSKRVQAKLLELLIKPEDCNMDEILMRLGLVFYDHCRHWNLANHSISGADASASLHQHIKSIQIDIPTSRMSNISCRDRGYMSLFQHSDDGWDFIFHYLDGQLRRITGSGAIASRISILNTLASVSAGSEICLSWFLVNPDVHMLKWYVEQYSIDLAAPLTKYPKLLTTIKQSSKLYWYAYEPDDETPINELPVSYVLLMESIRKDNLAAVEWLYPQLPHSLPDELVNIAFVFAISEGCYIVLKWILWCIVFPCCDAILNTINRADRIRSFRSHHIAEELVNFMGNSFIVDCMQEYYDLRGSAAIIDDWSVGAMKLQTFWRGARVKARYAEYLTQDYRDFTAVWGRVSVLLNLPSVPALTWSQLRAQCQTVVVESDVMVHLTQQMSEMDCNDVGEFATDAETRHNTARLFEEMNTAVTVQVTTIELSSHAVKWFEYADNRYRHMFQQRMVQLADGDRSYALSKPLKHCKYPIYETKLDAGMRILWVNVVRETVSSILVWFVSKHDIIGSGGTSVGDSHQSVMLGEDDVLIDPAGNCPLKVYKSSSAEMDGAVLPYGWKPPLQLSAKQSRIHDESGTVLLLGRSGTGKTICLCDNMSRDRASHVGSFMQLFVCRSRRLCEFVQAYQKQYCDADALQDMHFMTLSAFVSHVASNIESDTINTVIEYHHSSRADYSYFVTHIYPDIGRKCTISPAIVWLQIRSFIKGSVEAVLQRGALKLEQYTDLNVFGLDRCRLSVDDRREVFAMYLRYQDVLKSQGLWDDADYTLDLLNRSKLEPLSVSYDKVYVDEVQDNTQAEIVLYFLAAGMNTQSLFLAGDPAQSVVEGVDFRFEDVRSIVYS